MTTHADKVTNIVVAGLGGQGVITASDILADAAFHTGLDVKKSEIHGVSQRGGSVTSDVRFGPRVLSPMVPPGKGDFLVVLASDQVENNRQRLRPRGVLITALVSAPCPCGRTLRRMRRVARRSDDMLIIRGVNVFPSQVEAAILGVEGMLPHYQIVLTRDQGLDQIEVRVEITPAVFSDTVRGLEDLRVRLASAIEHTLGLRVVVYLVESRSLERSEGKASRVLDRREGVASPEVSHP
jgi:phenylacetate-CoA ligase